MQIAQVLAGYTLGGADLLRRAMGKKIKAEMDAQREDVHRGRRGTRRRPPACRADLRPDGEVRRLRLQQVARRRLCARRLPDRVSQGELSGRVPRRVDDARHRQYRQAQRLPRRSCDRLGITLLPPDINRSDVGFTVEDPAKTGEPAIRYALAAVKGRRRAGDARLVAERGAQRPVQGSVRFRPTVSTSRASTGGSSRASPRPALSTRSTQPRADLRRHRSAAAPCSRAAEDRVEPNRSVCSATSTTALRRTAALPGSTDWPPVEKLQQEFDAIGFYLSSHPLDRLRQEPRAAGVVAFGRSAGGARGGRLDPLQARRHRGRQEGAHLGARQPLRLRAAVRYQRRCSRSRCSRKCWRQARAAVR